MGLLDGDRPPFVPPDSQEEDHRILVIFKRAIDAAYEAQTDGHMSTAMAHLELAEQALKVFHGEMRGTLVYRRDDS